MFRQRAWRDVTPTAWREARVGKPRLAPADRHARIAAVASRVRELLTGRAVTFRQLMETSDAYESELREALKLLGVGPTMRPGFRRPLYTLPSTN